MLVPFMLSLRSCLPDFKPQGTSSTQVANELSAYLLGLSHRRHRDAVPTLEELHKCLTDDARSQDRPQLTDVVLQALPTVIIDSGRLLPDAQYGLLCLLEAAMAVDGSFRANPSLTAALLSAILTRALGIFAPLGTHANPPRLPERLFAAACTLAKRGIRLSDGEWTDVLALLQRIAKQLSQSAAADSASRCLQCAFIELCALFTTDTARQEDVARATRELRLSLWAVWDALAGDAARFRLAEAEPADEPAAQRQLTFVTQPPPTVEDSTSASKLAASLSTFQGQLAYPFHSKPSTLEQALFELYGDSDGPEKASEAEEDWSTVARSLLSALAAAIPTEEAAANAANCPLQMNYFLARALLRALANIFYTSAGARREGKRHLPLLVRSLRLAPSVDAPNGWRDLLIMAAAAALANVSFAAADVQRELAQLDIMAAFMSAASELSDLSNRADFLSYMGTCIAQHRHVVKAANIQPALKLVTDVISASSSPELCRAPLLVATTLLPFHQANIAEKVVDGFISASVDAERAARVRERLGGMAAICESATDKLSAHLKSTAHLFCGSPLDGVAEALLVFLVGLAHAVRAHVAAFAGAAIAILVAQSSTAASAHPLDLHVALELLRCRVRPEFIWLTYRRYLSRHPDHQGSVVMGPLAHYGRPRDMIRMLFRSELDHRRALLDANESDVDDVIAVVETMFQPSFEHIVREYLGSAPRPLADIVEEEIPEFAEHLGSVTTLAAYPPFFTSDPLPHEAECPSAGRMVRLRTVDRAAYREEWRDGGATDPQRTGLLQSLIGVPKEGVQMFFHATTHEGADGLKCRESKSDFARGPAAYLHRRFTGALNWKPRPMAILVYALPDDVVAHIKSAHGWRTFEPSPRPDDKTYDNEEWGDMVMSCRAPRRPQEFQEGDEKVVEGPIALPPFVQRPLNVLQGETRIAIRFPTDRKRNEVTRLFDQYLFAVIAFHATL